MPTPRSRYRAVAPSENSPETGSIVCRLRSEVIASARSSPRRDALAIERRAAQSARPSRIVDDRHPLARDTRTDLVREEAAPLEDVVGREKRTDRAEQLRRHPRIQDHR